MTAPRSPPLFFGRGPDVERLLALLAQVRLALVYGVGGVGKTSLMLRVAEQLARERSVPVAYVACRRNESALTLARVALAELGLAAEDPGRPLDRLLQAGGFVLLVDDAHLSESSGALELARFLATRADSVRVLVGSRERLPLSPVEVDHAVVKLAGLAAEAAEELWRALESLHGRAAAQGPGPTPIQGGNPFLIKRAFAECDGEPDRMGLGSLDPLSRRLLTELVALRRPGRRRWLAEGREPGALEAALATLERRFLTESDGDTYRVHALVREAVLMSPLAPDAAAHRRALGAYHAESSREGEVVERLHHAARAGERSLLHALLVEEGGVLRRIPPGGALLDREIAESIELVERDGSIPPELALLRARVHARLGQIDLAWSELSRLEGDETKSDLDVAEVAFMRGDAEASLARARRALGSSETSPIERVLAAAYAAEAHRTLGELDDMRTLLTGPELEALGPLAAGVRAWLEGVRAMDAERYADCLEDLTRAKQAFEVALPPSAVPLLVSFERCVRAHAGNDLPFVEGADELFDDSAYFRCIARLLSAEERLVFGQYAAAAEIAESNWLRGREIGSFPIESFAAWVWAEAMLGLGDPESVRVRVPPVLDESIRRRHVPPRLRLVLALAEAHAVLGEHSRAQELARSLLASSLDYPRIRARALRLAEGEQGTLPLTGFAHAEQCQFDAEAAFERGELARAAELAADAGAISGRFAWTGLAVRAGMTLCGVELLRGDVDQAEHRLESVEKTARELRHARATISASALRAALARSSGGLPRLPAVDALFEFLDPHLRSHGWARREFAEACRRLGLHRLARLEQIDSRGTRYHVEKPDLGDPRSYDLLVNATTSQVVVHGKAIDFGRRKNALDLLLAFVLVGPRWIEPAELARLAWQLDYHAVRHHSRLAMAVARLRELVGADLIESSRDGYRFRLPTRWMVLRSSPPPAA